jgi:hypothetical protein
MPHEQVMLMVLALTAVGFPSTLLGCYLLAGVAYVLLVIAGLNYSTTVDTLLAWMVLSTCGAVQWFVILPFIIGVIRKRLMKVPRTD